MSRSDCRCCSDCKWYLDWFCECPNSPFAFVAPSLPAWSCIFFRPRISDDSSYAQISEDSEDSEALIF